MHSFSSLSNEPFLVGESDLNVFLNRPYRLEWGIIFICVEGEAVISTEVISYDVKRHTKVTLLIGTIFTLQQATPDFKVKYIAFSHLLFQEANYRLEPSFIGFLKENPVYQVPPEKLNYQMGSFHFLHHTYHDHENRFRYEITRNYLQCIFWDTYDKTHRLFEHKKSNSSDHYVEIFRNFLSLVYLHYKEEREVAFYADKLCITPRYLSLVTKQVTQTKSPKDMINNQIILKIKVMLQSTQLSIQEIAHKLNFPDQSYLGRYFKRYTGKSPSEYRSEFR